MELEFKVKNLTAEDLSNILSVAFYGNEYMGISRYDKILYSQLPQDKISGECFEDKCADVLLNGGTIDITDYGADGEVYGCLNGTIDDDGNAVYCVCLDDILKGMSNPKAQRYVADFINENDDFYTGYNLIQIIVFGEIVYG